MAEARGLYERALADFREAGDPWGTARSLTDLAHINCEQGDYTAARSAFREALEIFAGLGHRRGAARALEGSACLALAQGQAERALALAAAASHVRQLISAPLHQAEKSKLDRALLPAWQCLVEAEGMRAWTKGSEMSLEEAIQYSLEELESATSP
jgi:tetratricopeptide (TPR) repeat protein